MQGVIVHNIVSDDISTREQLFSYSSSTPYRFSETRPDLSAAADKSVRARADFANAAKTCMLTRIDSTDTAPHTTP